MPRPDDINEVAAIVMTWVVWIALYTPVRAAVRFFMAIK